MGSQSSIPSLGLASFLKSGQYADFTITCGQYSFKVHKVVLCSKSRYFQKESTEKVVVLEDQQPIMIARMLQYLYDDKYDVSNMASALFEIFDNAGPPDYLDNAVFVQDLEFEVHANVYALADRFDIPSLKAESANKFVSELRSPTFSITNLVSAIGRVYTTTPESDLGLRKWVVYRAQQVEYDLARNHEFEQVLKDYPDFAWDFATKYARANHLWCSRCNNFVTLIECRCGFHGMCGDGLCKAGDVSVLRCMTCDEFGNLTREVPKVEEDASLGILGRTDAPRAPMRRSPRNKGRFR